MNGLKLTIRILLIRVAFAWARFLSLQRRVVFATAHADELGGNLAIVRDELATRRPAVRVVSFVHRPGTGVRGKLVATSSASHASARPRSTSQMEVPQHASRTRSSCRH